MSTLVDVRQSAARLLALVLMTAMLLVGAMTALEATEGHGPPPGIAPREANSTENEFRPDDYEANFLWGAAVGLTVLVIGGFGAVGGLYWMLVKRPQEQAKAEAATKG